MDTANHYGMLLHLYLMYMTFLLSFTARLDSEVSPQKLLSGEYILLAEVSHESYLLDETFR